MVQQELDLGATSYGTGTAIFAYGYDTLSMSNLVNTSGTIASDVSGVGTGRHNVAATNYGGNLGLFAYGLSGGTNQNMSNKSK